MNRLVNKGLGLQIACAIALAASSLWLACGATQAGPQSLMPDPERSAGAVEDGSAAAATADTAGPDADEEQQVLATMSAHGQSYRQHNLVSDGFISADHLDPNLLNAWGVAFNPTGFVWVADNHAGVSTLYDGLGNPQTLVVTIPPPPGGSPPAAPTGIVFNGTANSFVISDGANHSGTAAFLFATEDGTISGWSPAVPPPPPSTSAFRAVNNAGSAIYKGLAIAHNGSALRLYATDFHNGKIDVFDDHFAPVVAPGGFADSEIPRHFAPFGIRNIGGALYVTYAKQDADAEDDVSGKGLGFVNIFDADGHRLRRLVSRGDLNAPWGLALAPSDFGPFSNNILIGNFGDGVINAYDLDTGRHRGALRGPDGRKLSIEGLWGISFGNGVQQQPTNTLFFASGPADEQHGLYGRIDFVSGP